MNELTGLDYQKLAQALIASYGGQTLKATSSTPNATYGYGPGGLFNVPGISAPVFSALQLPIYGLQSRLPSFANNLINPIKAILTGQTANTGSQPIGVCDPPKIVGNLKLCTQTLPYGRWSLGTKVYDVSRVGAQTNNAVNQNLSLANTPDLSGFGPTMPGGGAKNPFKNELEKALFELGIGWAYEYGRTLYTGDPSNNTSGGGYQEPFGLETLVNDNHYDAITKVLCPAADSIVYDFSSANITTDATAATALVNRVTWIYRSLKDRAAKARLRPVKWVIVTHPTAFYDMAEIWACNYSTARCNQTAAGATQYLSADAIIKLRDGMRGNSGDPFTGTTEQNSMFDYTGQYLLIDGEKVEVILDDTIPYAYNGGTGVYTADLYILPLQVQGRTNSLYMEYFDFTAPGAAIDFLKAFPGAINNITASDGGRFLWASPPATGWCIEMWAMTMPRFILETPFLAARVDNISWTPLLSFRNPFPGESNYVDGGFTAADTAWNNYARPDGASQYLFFTQPSGAAAGVALTTQPVVKAYLPDGTTVDTDFNGTVNLRIKAGTGTAGAVLAGTTSIHAVNGVATFAGLSINLAGVGYKLQAYAPTFTAVDSNALTIT